jgi:hypothetical protein
MPRGRLPSQNQIIRELRVLFPVGHIEAPSNATEFSCSCLRPVHVAHTGQHGPDSRWRYMGNVGPYACVPSRTRHGSVERDAVCPRRSDQVGNSTATVEVYNPVTDTWTFTHALMRLITTRLLWQEETSTVSAPEQERPMFMIRTATLGLQRRPACYASYERDA